MTDNRVNSPDASHAVEILPATGPGPGSLNESYEDEPSAHLSTVTYRACGGQRIVVSRHYIQDERGGTFSTTRGSKITKVKDMVNNNDATAAEVYDMTEKNLNLPSNLECTMRYIAGPFGCGWLRFPIRYLESY